MDEYVEIPGYPGYKINRNGDCIGPYKKILKPCITNQGYLVYCLHGIIGQIIMKVHRLVALTFIPNPQGLATVNHKDENKKNNCVDNLEWMSAAENIRRTSRVVNGKCYHLNKKGWQVSYAIEGKQHKKGFKDEEDAQFYVSLLKAIYPRF